MEPTAGSSAGPTSKWKRHLGIIRSAAFGAVVGTLYGFYRTAQHPPEQSHIPATWIIVMAAAVGLAAFALFRFIRHVLPADGILTGPALLLFTIAQLEHFWNGWALIYGPFAAYLVDSLVDRAQRRREADNAASQTHHN